MMIGRKLMGLEGFTDIFNDFFSARVHQCLRHVSIYLLSVFVWDHPYITSAKGLGGRVQKMAIFAAVQ